MDTRRSDVDMVDITGIESDARCVDDDGWISDDDISRMKRSIMSLSVLISLFLMSISIVNRETLTQFTETVERFTKLWREILDGTGSEG